MRIGLDAARAFLAYFGRFCLCSGPWAAVVLFALCFPGNAKVQAQETNKNVLVLFSAVKYSDEFLNAVEPAIRSRVPGQITFYDAYLDDLRVADEAYRQSEAEAFRLRYSGVNFNLVIVTGATALDFAVDYRGRIFPGTPIVFAGISNGDLARQKSWPGVTGITTPLGFRETIDLALRLEPDTKAVAVVAGVTPWDSGFLANLRSALVPYQGKIKEIDLVEAPGPDVLKTVDALPPHTIVMFQELPQFSNQPQVGTWNLIPEIARRRPTYSAFVRLCVDGCVGGVFEDIDTLSSSAAQLASRVLRGERADDIPIVQNTGLHPQVDWRALQRWHIPESAVPPGSVVLFREPSLWERGRDYFLLGITVIFLQSVFILGLFGQHARNRKTEAALRRSEERFSKAFRQSPLSITIVSADDGRYVDVNGTFEECTGWRRDELVGRTPLEIGLWVDPNKRALFLQEIHAKGTVRNLEVKFRKKDGEIRDSLGSAELIEVSGQKCVLSVIADITERKAAEEALASLGGRLLEAQEAERTRIARELHDDISQRLAMVALTLKSLKKRVPAPEAEMHGYIEDASKTIHNLAEDVQALSHRLHSSKLEFLGLEVAAESFCAEVSERQNIQIDFRCDGVSEALTDNIALCLFRVLQEGVHNAVKHSGAGQIEVSLTGTSSEIQLRVHDSGTGFDIHSPNGHGLGLTSMRERLKLVNGKLSIGSTLGQGTTIRACAPVEGGAGPGIPGVHESISPDTSSTSPVAS